MTMTRLDFHHEGLFHDMVTAYMAALAGLIVFRKEFNFDSSVKIGIASTEYPALDFPVQEIKSQFDAGAFTIGSITDRLAYMLLNSAVEAAKAKYGEQRWTKLRQRHPEVEFACHARNAASHGGHWHFEHGEPRRQAEWRGREVTASLEGAPLWDARLKPGDLLLLLWDLENLLP